MFDKVLIADRGEVVLRIARTCDRMGIATVAVYSEPEAESVHASACDQAVCVGPARSEESYLNPMAILEAARSSGAQAIHPGGGALAGDASFARAVAEAGLVFVGAGPDAPRGVGDRANLTELARLAGVRTLAHERTIESPRLLSVLLAADDQDCVALGECEHSLQRAGRGLLSESPAPLLAQLPGGEPKRGGLWEGAVAIGVEAGLRGLGSAAFLVDAEGRSYFWGLAVGLPAQHGLVEMCTDLDFVEAQLRVAAGERLPPEVLRAQATGHALQADVYAELPPGAPALAIKALRWPMVAPGALRIETDLAVGHRAGLEYDSLVARVVTYGQTRHQAILTLDRVLAEASIDPLPTNLPFLREILTHESYRAGQYDSEFAERLLADLKAGPW